MIDLYKSNENYIIHEFKNKDDWLKMRLNGIGGSDLSALVGLNPYKTSEKLYKEKKGLIEIEDISEKPFVQYGNQAEEYLRKLFELHYPNLDVQYKENTLLQNVKYPFMFFSPDGLLIDKETGKKGILEIKTTNILQSMHYERWNERIPDNYLIQCLQGLLVTGFDFVILKAELKFTKKDDLSFNTKHYVIRREDFEDYINDVLLAKGMQFWNYIESDKIAPIAFEI